MNTTTLIETVLLSLKYYDPSAPGTLVTASGLTGSYSKQFLFKTAHSNFYLKNNYQVPCNITAYICKPKVDTSTTPTVALDNSLADVTTSLKEDPLVFVTDGPQFSQVYNIIKTVKKTIQPGSSINVSHSEKPFSYDPSVADTLTGVYTKRANSTVMLLRVEGDLGHDSVQDEQAIGAAGIDILQLTTYKVEYDAGVDIHQVITNDNADTITNALYMSSKPVCDNIQYSVA